MPKKYIKQHMTSYKDTMCVYPCVSNFISLGESGLLTDKTMKWDLEHTVINKAFIKVYELAAPFIKSIIYNHVLQIPTDLAFKDTLGQCSTRRNTKWASPRLIDWNLNTAGGKI